MPHPPVLQAAVDAVNNLGSSFLAVPNCAEVGRGTSIEAVKLDAAGNPLPVYELDLDQGEPGQAGQGSKGRWVRN